MLPSRVAMKSTEEPRKPFEGPIFVSDESIEVIEEKSCALNSGASLKPSGKRENRNDRTEIVYKSDPWNKLQDIAVENELLCSPVFTNNDQDKNLAKHENKLDKYSNDEPTCETTELPVKISQNETTSNLESETNEFLISTYAKECILQGENLELEYNKTFRRKNECDMQSSDKQTPQTCEELTAITCPSNEMNGYTRSIEEQKNGVAPTSNSCKEVGAMLDVTKSGGINDDKKHNTTDNSIDSNDLQNKSKCTFDKPNLMSTNEYKSLNNSGCDVTDRKTKLVTAVLEMGLGTILQEILRQLKLAPNLQVNTLVIRTC